MKNSKFFIYIVSLYFIFTPFIVESREISYWAKDPEYVHDIIAIIGTGYVGLVTGAGLAALGNTVICADINQEKINILRKGQIPIYEPGLHELITYGVDQEKLSFTSDVSGAIQKASIIFIAVGTPTNDVGHADLTALWSVVDMIASNMNTYKTIVTKSTVPIGTGYKISRILTETYGLSEEQFAVVSNPEFLREGSAVEDFLNPDRIVIGAEKEKDFERLSSVYHVLIKEGVPFIGTNIPTAELIKYASNAFLATKLSFINEIANLCDATGAFIKTVAYAMGLDNRISPRFLHPGPGYGGSCFPKDTQALLHIASQYNVQINTVDGAIKTNALQQLIPVKKLNEILPSCSGKTIAILGLAFKGNTDDVRYSPSITVVKELLAQGAVLCVYDPQAMRNFADLFPMIVYCNSIYEAVENADALIIMTEWEEFKYINLDRIKKSMREAIIIDARNLLDPCQVAEAGFYYDNIGQAVNYTR